MSTDRRQYVKYTFYSVAPEWRALPAAERDAHKLEIVELLERHAERVMIRTYSTVGTRGDCDFLLWTVSYDLDDIQQIASEIAGSAMGPYLETPHSYLAMTKRSQYIDKHTHEGQEGARLRIRPADKKYFFVYPFWKTHDWYQLARDERQTMMDEHIRIGHKYPSVRINTGYSFGLDDQEFVVAFETDFPADFLDLVMELREAVQRKYTLRDTPIFTCVAKAPREMLDLVATPARTAVGA
ncbi:MAG: chlorite dismutase family protein [Chloroflexota bacterium]